MYTESELSEKNGPELLAIYNNLAPTPVTKFKSKQVGVSRILRLVEATEAEPVEGAAVEVASEPKLPEGPKRNDPKSRAEWVRVEATDAAQALNRKELAIFHGTNPNGLVALFVAGGGDPEENDAAAFLVRFGTIAKWPSVKDTNAAIAELGAALA